MRRTALALAWVLAAAPAAAQLPAPADEWHPPAPVEAAVRRAVAARWAVGADSVRLAWTTVGGATPLPAGPVALAGSGDGGYWTVRVGPQAAPRALRVRAGVERSAATAARDLPRGYALTAADLAPGRRVEWGAPRPAASGGVGPGWVTRRVIAAGEALAPPAVEAPLAVRVGDTVRVAVRRGAAVLELRGVAAGAGRPGDRVPVRVAMGWRVDATVRGPGALDAAEKEPRR